MRRDSWRSVPSTYRPPTSRTPSPSLMSTPRPAMFVAIVTARSCPASLMISASRACSFAFRTLCGTPARVSTWERYSEVSTAMVPTSTRSEEHTSELQSPYDLVCRLLLEKKKKNKLENESQTEHHNESIQVVNEH